MKQADFRLAEALGNDLGDKRLDILRRIGDRGSISSAARAAGVSYKAAWQAIDTLANLAGTPLVDTAVGGSGGGGTRLTAAAWRLLDAAERISAARAAVLAELARETDEQLPVSPGTSRDAARRDARPATGGRHDPGFPQGGPTANDRQAPGAGAAVAGLGLRTSLRNQLPCRVSTLQRQGSLVRVGLRLADDSVICSRITRESAELLALAPGLGVLALCKATALVIRAAPPDSTVRPAHAALATDLLSRRRTMAKTPVPAPPRDQAPANLLPGTVVRTARATAGSAELALELASGLRLVGFAAAGHGLITGSPALAVFDETAVVIALAQA